MIAEIIPAIMPIIRSAVSKETFTVPIFFCHKTDSEVITPKVKNPCLIVSQKTLGKNGTFFSFIVK